MMQSKTISFYIILFACVAGLVGCNSNPTVSSSSGIPSGSPSSTPSTPSPSPTNIPGTTPGGEISQTPSTPSPSQGSSSSSGTEQGNETSSTQTSGGQQGEKTDDQILADALDEFGKRNQTTSGDNSGNEQGSGQITVAGPGGGSATEAEKAAELDKRLGEKFAKFDDLILGEREAGSREGSGNGNGDFGSEDGSGSNDEGPLQTAAIEPPEPGSSHGGIPSQKPSNSVSYKPPTDVGSGHDDDIIARQLREAAMKEQDPELRAKLWDEYRKYKKSS